MKSLLMILAVLAFGFAAAVSTPAQAGVEGKSHDGTVVSTSAGKLTMKDETGKEHSHDVGPTVKITVNGKPGKLDDLKMGMRIRVMTDENGQVMAISTIDTEKRW